MKIKGVTTKWLLRLGAAGVVIVLALIVALTQDQLAGRPGQTSLSDPPELGTTATEAYRAAAEEATGWQEDAQLVGAVAHYSNPGAGTTDAQWAFQFYSPAAHRLSLIVVIEGQARQVRDVLSPYRVPTTSRKRWRIDSDEALRIWWERGGQYLLTRRPSADLTLRLEASEDHGEVPVWTVVGTIPDVGTDHTVTLSGLDGSVLEE